MPNGQYADEVVGLGVPVQRNIAGSAPRDDELAQSFFSGSAHQRMALEHGKRIMDELNRLCRLTGAMFRQEISEPLEIRESAVVERYLGQRLRRGLRTRLPAARARMYFLTSSSA